MKIRVYYEDVDINGIVYHTNYMKYCERARSEMFFSNGIKPFGDDFFFVVKSLQSDFVSGAKLGDELEVETCTNKRRKTSVELQQNIYLDKKLIFAMSIILVYMQDNKIAKIPSDFADVFATQI
jgi:acyl-CoA thioester hydrolase